MLVVIEAVFVGVMILFGILLFSTATSRQLQQRIQRRHLAAGQHYDALSRHPAAPLSLKTMVAAAPS